MLLSQAISQYEQHLQAKRRSPRTLLWYHDQFAAYIQWRAEQDIAAPDELPTAELIDTFLAAQHAAGLAPSTVNARYRALRALLKFLEKRRHMTYEQNPIHLVEAPTVPKQIRRHVTIDDLDALLAAITGTTWLDHRDRVILLILFYSGLRVGELCDLVVADVDVTALVIVVHRGKGDRARVVPCAPELAPALTAYLYTRPNHSDALLLKSDGYGGSAGALQPEGVRQMLIRRCKQAELRPFSPHAFRHGFAMWLLNSGARATTVATAMGHSSEQLTLAIYAHTTVRTVRREYDEALARRKRQP